VIVGVALAVACAVATSAAFLFKHRGAVLAPAVDIGHPLRSAAGLFRSKWFAVGWLVALGAWGLHAGALALAPLSTVQAVLSGGLVFLAVFAERFFGLRLGRRQWVGVIVTAAGLAIIGITSGSEGETHPYAVAALIAGRVRRASRGRRGGGCVDPPARPVGGAGPAPSVLPRARCSASLTSRSSSWSTTSPAGCSS
jgi:drug/metabolite transporter (DMT)-like permease